MLIKTVRDSMDFTDSIWFDYFENNTQLQALIEQGILSNKDLVIASSRVDRALAELRVIQPNRLPTVDINAQGKRQKINEASQTFLSSEALSNEYTASLGLRWEIDLWGSLRNQVQFSRAQLESSQANLKICPNVDCFTNSKDLVEHYAHSRSDKPIGRA